MGSFLQKRLDELTAVIERQRSGMYHIHLEAGSHRYKGTYEALTRWGAGRIAKRLLRNERKYLTSQTEWLVR